MAGVDTNVTMSFVVNVLILGRAAYIMDEPGIAY
jgi:hypothetical protein